ncbi:hypothetical protein EF294_18615 [Gordonia oryzae]|uniref:Uncharacterized protein n=1 Tax=Gordonia oryzae TaxID=2487349 RepID=A0A3N4GWD1_9ACTN|nr:hypothetical protein [Gordonia oryzae]RPA57284.1 hypothetical protein EF294_18615 [Gordonia oryzae]
MNHTRRLPRAAKVWTSWGAFSGFLDWNATPTTITELLKAWQSLRTINDPADVPERAIVLTQADGSLVCRFDHGHGVVFGDDRPFPWTSTYLRGPLHLDWHPTDGIIAR